MEATKNTSLKSGLAGIWETRSLSILFFAYCVISVIATCQGIFHGAKIYVPGGRPYTDYNNYVIFKYSFFHLAHYKDIYQYFPDDHWDLYKYSPGFSVLFGLLAWMPDPIGLLAWNLINTLSFYAGIKMLPGIDNSRKSWILLLCLPEMLLSIQNSQSNGLMAGLIILAFAFAERSRFGLSTLCIVCSIFIKIFGGLAFVFYLFYPGKPKIIGWSLVWILVFTFLPLTLVNMDQLGFLYHSWLTLLKDDHTASTGLSVMGLLGTWFHLDISKNLVALAGLILFIVPLIHIRKFKDYYFRLLYLASVLIWIVIFNHKAESPTFIIAIAGIGIWYFSQARGTWNTIMVVLAFFLISLSVSDLVPSGIKNDIVKPYAIKAVMPVIIWCRILYEQLALRYKPERLI